MILISKTMTNTGEHKIKSFTIQQKHFNKLLLYKWSIVEIVIININGKLNTTMS